MPGRGPASISRMRPWAVRWSASAVSSAASRPSRFISYTVKMTRQCGGVRLDLPRRPQGFLEPGADPLPGADLLAEDLVFRDAVLAERVELGVEFLPEGRASRVPNADVRARQVRADRGRGRGCPGATVGPGRGRSGSARAALSSAGAPG